MKYLSLFLPLFTIFCFQSNGQVIDSTFGEAFYFGHPLPGATAIDFDERDDRSYATLFLDDGKIILAGHTAWDGESDFAFARLLPDGKFDQTAGPDGKVQLDLGYENDSCLAASLYLGNKILMGGCAQLQGQGGFAALLVRTDLDGNLDTDFGDQGQVVVDLPGYREVITKLLPLADGKIIIAGNIYYGGSYQFPDSTKIFVGRVDQSGQIDATFGSNGFIFQGFNDCPSTLLGDIAITADGSMVLTGAGYYPYPGVNVPNIMCNTGITISRLLPDGEPDPGFGENGVVMLPVTSGRGNALEIYEDGRILIAGMTSDFLTDPIYTIVARLMPNGTIDSTFNGDGYFRQFLNGFLGDGTEPVGIKILNDEILIGFIDSPLGPHLTFGVFFLKDNGQLNTDFGISGIFSYQDLYPWTNYQINYIHLSEDRQSLYFGGYYKKLLHENMMVCRLDIGGKSPVKTNAIEAFGGISIWPNPSNGEKLYFDLSGIPIDKEVRIWIFDSFGMIALKERISYQKTQEGIILPALANGLYFVELLVEKRRYINKILVQR
jgi:uncharacterized delta-60 repeat protein